MRGERKLRAELHAICSNDMKGASVLNMEVKDIKIQLEH